MKQKWMALILAAALCLGLLPTAALAAGTLKASEAKTQVEKLLADLQTQSGFRPGDSNKNCFTFAMSVTNKLFGIKLSDIEYHGEKEKSGNSKQGYLIRIGRCFQSHSGYYCKYSSSGATSLNEANVKALLTQAKCGDVIQTTRKTSSGHKDTYANANCETRHPHTMIVQSVSQSSVTVYEGNMNGGKVNIRSISYKDFASTYNHTITLFRAENYDKVNGGSSGGSTAVNDTPNIAPTTEPGENLPQGKPFYFKGKITTTSKITSATISILSPDGKTTYQTKTITPNTATVDIATSGLDALKFGQLSPGAYLFYLTATSQSGKTSSWQKGFSIAGAAPAPTPAPTPAPAPKTYTISVHYTKDGVGYAPATLTVNEGETRVYETYMEGIPSLVVMESGTWDGARTLTFTNVRSNIDAYVYYETPQAVEPEPPKDTGYTLTINYYIDGVLSYTDHSPDGDGSSSYIYEMPQRYRGYDYWYTTSNFDIGVFGTELWIPEFSQNESIDLWANSDGSVPAEFTTPSPTTYTVAIICEDENGNTLLHDPIQVQEGDPFTYTTSYFYLNYQLTGLWSDYSDYDWSFDSTDSYLVTISIPAVYQNGSIHLTYSEPAPSTPYGLANFTAKNAYYGNTFYDVRDYDWFSLNVETAYTLGLMKGTGSGTFSPNANVTLAEVITLAARIHSIYYTGSDSFPSYDGGSWYDPYVDYALEHSIITEAYNYSLPATREQVVRILSRALPEDEFPAITEISFADSGDITYRSEVRLLSRAGVINGININGFIYFYPYNPITRAEIAAIVGRMVQPGTRVR